MIVKKNLKLILVGDGGVGKTSLAHRIVMKRMNKEYITTVGLDVHTRTFGDGKNKVKLVVCDFSGQFTFSKIISQLSHGANCVFLVFDITRRETLYSVYSWANEIKERVAKNAIFILVGNKSDLRGKVPTVTKEEAEKAAEDLSEILGRPVCYVEVSALTGKNIHKLVNHVLNRLSVKLSQFSS